MHPFDNITQDVDENESNCCYPETNQIDVSVAGFAEKYTTTQRVGFFVIVAKVRRPIVEVKSCPISSIENAVQNARHKPRLDFGYPLILHVDISSSWASSSVNPWN